METASVDDDGVVHFEVRASNSAVQSLVSSIEETGSISAGLPAVQSITTELNAHFLQVHVSSVDGAPVAGVALEALGLNAVTDSQGSHRFAGLAPGSYVVTAELPGSAMAPLGVFADSRRQDAARSGQLSATERFSVELFGCLTVFVSSQDSGVVVRRADSGEQVSGSPFKRSQDGSAVPANQWELHWQLLPGSYTVTVGPSGSPHDITVVSQDCLEYSSFVVRVDSQQSDPVTVSLSSAVGASFQRVANSTGYAVFDFVPVSVYSVIADGIPQQSVTVAASRPDAMPLTVALRSAVVSNEQTVTITKANATLETISVGSNSTLTIDSNSVTVDTVSSTSGSAVVVSGGSDLRVVEQIDGGSIVVEDGGSLSLGQNVTVNRTVTVEIGEGATLFIEGSIGNDAPVDIVLSEGGLIVASAPQFSLPSNITFTSDRTLLPCDSRTITIAEFGNASAVGPPPAINLGGSLAGGGISTQTSAGAGTLSLVVSLEASENDKPCATAVSGLSTLGLPIWARVLIVFACLVAWCIAFYWFMKHRNKMELAKRSALAKADVTQHHDAQMESVKRQLDEQKRRLSELRESGRSSQVLVAEDQE